MIRLATAADIPELNELIARSARALSRGYYTPDQVESAIRFVFGVDSQLIADGTYYAGVDEGRLVACGGWSFRRTLYGGDQRPVGAGETLDPTADAARIRAFFVDGTQSRHGWGTRLLETSADAAADAGFTRVELMSTLPGIPFYLRHGFREVSRITDVLPDGVILELALMERG
jgi:GNAT superfamily N-acetyltransferase